MHDTIEAALLGKAMHRKANSDEEIAPDYDLTCWYLNVRRVLELVGANNFAFDIQRLEALSRLDDVAKKYGLLATLKNHLTEWLRYRSPPTLGQLLVEHRLRPGMLFTHYDRYFCKGLPRVMTALNKGRMPVAAEAYAKLDTFEAGLTLSFRFHHDHLTSDSAWSELQGQRRLMVLGAATDIVDRQIEALPWVMADPLPGLFSPHSFVGRHWNNRLEIFVESIESFARVRDVPPVRSQRELSKLRDIPEREIKAAFAEIIAENSVNPDWGGEQSDLFSTQVQIDGHRMATTFAFKGRPNFIQ